MVKGPKTPLRKGLTGPEGVVLYTGLLVPPRFPAPRELPSDAQQLRVIHRLIHNSAHTTTRLVSLY